MYDALYNKAPSIIPTEVPIRKDETDSNTKARGQDIGQLLVSILDLDVAFHMFVAHLAPKLFEWYLNQKHTNNLFWMFQKGQNTDSELFNSFHWAELHPENLLHSLLTFQEGRRNKDTTTSDCVE